MNIDEYKMLMNFHLLLSDVDLSEMHYAAVDKNGFMFVYINEPDLSDGNGNNNVEMWYTFYEDKEHYSGYELVAKISPQSYWKDTKVKL